jgi:hypothetical protein
MHCSNSRELFARISERGLFPLGPRFRFLGFFITLCIEPRHQILWRRIEKHARNLLKEVDENGRVGEDVWEALRFSTVLTKMRWGITAPIEDGETVCHGFHRFTGVITTTRFH